jgi:acyl-CoA thioesterase FadM
MAFKRPLYFGDVALCTSRVERFGNTSFVVGHEFRQGDNPDPVATGNEVRVWGYAEADNPAKLLARAMPEEIRAMLSVEKSVDVSV